MQALAYENPRPNNNFRPKRISVTAVNDRAKISSYIYRYWHASSSNKLFTPFLKAIKLDAVHHLRSPALWGDARDALTQWMSLPDDWDGEDTPVVGSEAFARFGRAIEAGVAIGVPSPRPYFSSDGEIGLRWKLRDRRSVLSFTPDDSVLGYAASVAGSVRIRSVSDWIVKREIFFNTIRDSASQ